MKSFLGNFYRHLANFFLVTLHLILLEKLPRDFPSLTRPFVVWQKIFGELCVDRLGLGRSLEVGLLLEERVNVVL